MLNTVALIGNLGSDPDVRFTQSGTAVANLNLAVSEFYKDAAGESRKRTYWFRATAFGKTAEIARRFLAKGARVGISGSLVQREWEDKEGVKRSTVEVRVNQLELLASRQDRPDDAGEQYAQAQQGKARQHFESEGCDQGEDIPF